MHSRISDPDYNDGSSGVLQTLRQNLPILAFLIFATAGLLVVYRYYTPAVYIMDRQVDDVTSGASVLMDPSSPIAPIYKPVAPAVQQVQQSPPPLLIGIIAGHRGSDSGTECEDGLTEVQVTSGIAERLVLQLNDEGIPAETLDEFDVKLENYNATALVSIHIDSCDYINDLATGFKIAGSPLTDSSSLSICVQEAYASASQLPYHPNSITPHMANYHAFYKISSGTPAIIIEIGFLHLDRERLTFGSDILVQGLADGIMCFLNDRQ
jgi:N-acetylmuramoyl-L-alanine amidase